MRFSLSHLWKRFQDEMADEKTFTKKAQMFFLVSCQKYQDSRHHFQNPKVQQSGKGFSNRAQSFTTPYYLEVDRPFH